MTRSRGPVSRFPRELEEKEGEAALVRPGGRRTEAPAAQGSGEGGGGEGRRGGRSQLLQPPGSRPTPPAAGQSGCHPWAKRPQAFRAWSPGWGPPRTAFPSPPQGPRARSCQSPGREGDWRQERGQHCTRALDTDPSNQRRGRGHRGATASEGQGAGPGAPSLRVLTEPLSGRRSECRSPLGGHGEPLGAQAVIQWHPECN